MLKNFNRVLLLTAFLFSTIGHADTFNMTTGVRQIENATSDGDIIWTINDGGTKKDVMKIDAANAVPMFPLMGTGLVHSSSGGSLSSSLAVNADISSSAAIAYSKMAALSSGNIVIGNSSTVPTARAVSGDISLSDLGVTNIQSGVIDNADINASAAIDFSKLATLSSTNLLVGSAGGVATSRTITGDVTIGNTGVTAISSGVIVDADVNASAAIAGSKVTTATSAAFGVVKTWVPTESSSVSAGGNADLVIGNSDAIRLWSWTTGNTNRTITLPDANANGGRVVIIRKADSGTGFVTVSRAGSDTIVDSGASGLTSRTLYEFGNAITLQSTGSGNWVILEYHISYAFTATYTWNTGASTTTTVRLARSNNTVTGVTGAAQATTTSSSNVFTSTPAFPTEFRPTSNDVHVYPALVDAGTSSNIGKLRISTAGVFTLQKTAGSVFAAGTSGFNDNTAFGYMSY